MQWMEEVLEVHQDRLFGCHWKSYSIPSIMGLLRCDWASKQPTLWECFPKLNKTYLASISSLSLFAYADIFISYVLTSTLFTFSSLPGSHMDVYSLSFLFHTLDSVCYRCDCYSVHMYCVLLHCTINQSEIRFRTHNITLHFLILSSNFNSTREQLVTSQCPQGQILQAKIATTQSSQVTRSGP